MNEVLISISLAGIIPGLFLALYMLIKPGNSLQSRIWTSLFLIIGTTTLGLIILPQILAEAVKNSFFYSLETFISLCTGPVLYFMMKPFFSDQRINKVILLVHFLIPVTFLVSQIVMSSTASFPVIWTIMHMHMYTLWLLVAIIIKYKSNNSSRSLSFPVFIAAIMVFIHLAQWLRFFTPTLNISAFIVPVAIGLLIYVFLGTVLFKPTLFNYGRNQPSRDDNVKNISPSLWSEIVSLMDNRKLYLESGLTLDYLSDQSGISSHRISSAINHKHEGGFNQFVNEYRIDEAKKMLLSSDYEHYTLSAIGEECGFNSRSTFYEAFKKQTGMTPGEFKRKSCCPKS